MAFSLEGHVAIVTGNSSGLGKEIGMALGQAGAKVPVNFCYNEERAQNALEEYQAAGIDTCLIQASAITEDGIDKLFSETERQLGNPDILVPNATCDQPHKPIDEYDWAFYQDMIDFFIKSPFLMTQRGMASMKQQGWGRIVNIVSEVYHRSVGDFSAYVAAKGGQVGWTRSMATEFADTGITGNMIAPGWIPTDRHADDPEEEKDGYLALIPAGRWGIPRDVADAVLYFASEEASFVTGQTLCVNGGMTPW